MCPFSLSAWFALGFVACGWQIGAISRHAKKALKTRFLGQKRQKLKSQRRLWLFAISKGVFGSIIHNLFVPKKRGIGDLQIFESLSAR